MSPRAAALFSLAVLGCSGGASPGSFDAGLDDAPVSDTGVSVDATPDAAKSEAGVLEPDLDALPWQTGANAGYGVAYKDTMNPRGDAVFIGYAGYGISLASAEAWVTALYKATLRDRGVRHVWAVQGPSTASYSQLEIGNSKIAAALVPIAEKTTSFILIAGHSSGSFVAHELLGQLAGGHDPNDVTKGRVVYFDLDGGGSGLDAAIVARLRRAYFVGARDGATWSPNATAMQSLGATFSSAGGYWEHDASASGCNSGARWCVHVTLVITRPHDPANADPATDYSDFANRPVCTTWIEAKSAEAALHL